MTAQTHSNPDSHIFFWEVKENQRKNEEAECKKLYGI